MSPLLEWLDSTGADKAGESTRVYLSTFMVEPTLAGPTEYSSAPMPRCSATSAPNYECDRESGHKGVHFWRAK